MAASRRDNMHWHTGIEEHCFVGAAEVVKPELVKAELRCPLYEILGQCLSVSKLNTYADLFGLLSLREVTRGRRRVEATKTACLPWRFRAQKEKPEGFFLFPKMVGVHTLASYC